MPLGSGISISGLYSLPGSMPGGKSDNGESNPNTEVKKNIVIINKLFFKEFLGRKREMDASDPVPKSLLPLLNSFNFFKQIDVLCDLLQIHSIDSLLFLHP